MQKIGSATCKSAEKVKNAKANVSTLKLDDRFPKVEKRAEKE